MYYVRTMNRIRPIRIATARLEAGFASAEEFGAAIGVSGQAVRDWEKGKSHPRPANLEKIIEVTGKPIQYFYGEEGAGNGGDALAETVRRLERMMGAGTVQSVADAGGFARVPVYGRAAAGGGGIVDQTPQEYRHIPVSWIPQGQERECILVEAQGDSMIDAGLREGDLLLACPTVAVHDGDVALIETADSLMVKRVFHRDEDLLLISENASVPHRIVPRSEVRWMARVMWARKDFGRWTP